MSRMAEGPRDPRLALGFLETALPGNTHQDRAPYWASNRAQSERRRNNRHPRRAQTRVWRGCSGSIRVLPCGRVPLHRRCPPNRSRKALPTGCLTGTRPFLPGTLPSPDFWREGTHGGGAPGSESRGGRDALSHLRSQHAVRGRFEHRAGLPPRQEGAPPP